MEKEIIGSFNYKKTINGNLLGEFINNYHEQVFVNCSEYSGNDFEKDSFEGKYQTIWQETGIPISLELSISKNTSSKFSLIWRNKETKATVFKGEGFLKSDKLMLGYYLST